MTDKSIKIECPCGVMKHDIHVPILMKLLDKGSCSGCGKTIREVVAETNPKLIKSKE